MGPVHGLYQPLFNTLPYLSVFTTIAQARLKCGVCREFGAGQKKRGVTCKVLSAGRHSSSCKWATVLWPNDGGVSDHVHSGTV